MSTSLICIGAGGGGEAILVRVITASSNVGMGDEGGVMVERRLINEGVLVLVVTSSKFSWYRSRRMAAVSLRNNLVC